MKKLYLLNLTICFVFIGFISSPAQDDKMMLSGYVGYHMPMGKAADSYKSSIGFQLQFEYLITKVIGIDLTAGYIPWNFENAPSSWAFSIIPVTIGGRYYILTKGMSYYAGIDLGMYNTTFKNDTEKINKSKFGFSILGGVLLPLGDFLYLNGNLSYTNINTEGYSFSYFSIHAGVSYPF